MQILFVTWSVQTPWIEKVIILNKLVCFFYFRLVLQQFSNLIRKRVNSLVAFVFLV